MDPDPTPSGSRVLVKLAAAGVLLSALITAASFTTFGADSTFLRYPLLGASLVTVAIAGLSTGHLPAFNKTLWAHAPWWARVSWLTIIAAGLGTLTTISRSETAPTPSVADGVLETRGIGAVATYVFLIAALRCNVDLAPDRKVVG